jgi:FkbM family methyltransferase
MTELVTLPNGMTVEAPSRGEATFLYEEIFTGGAYLGHGIEVSDGATVFDVGANIGLFSAALTRGHRNLKLHLFEPIPSTFAILERNVQRVLANAEVKLRRVALVARPGWATLEFNPKWSLDAGIDTQTFARAVRREVGLEAWTHAFVHDAARAGGISPRVARRLEQALRRPLVGRLMLGLMWLLERVVTERQRRSVQRIDCPVTTVSEAMREGAVETIDLLKIDVEGAEWEVLQGVDESDWPRLRQLIIEVHNTDGRVQQVRELLESKGFAVSVGQDDWALLRLMDVHMVYGSRCTAARPSKRPITSRRPAIARRCTPG